MNQQNLEKLKENLKFMGFGDKLYPDLEKNIGQGFPEFVLKMQSEFGRSKLENTLHFRKGDSSDLYFFNRHEAVLKNDVGVKEQTFYVSNGRGVTLKESFNLLEGRAVYKEMQPREGEKYHAWIQLDFTEKENGNYKLKQFHDNYGYDLAATLEKFPIKALGDPTGTERLLASLQRGNLQSVEMETNGKGQRFFIEANPQYKSLTIYNGDMKMLSKEEREGLARTKNNGKEVPMEGPQQGKEIKSAEKKGKDDTSLLPKNRNSERKGLSV